MMCTLLSVVSVSEKNAFPTLSQLSENDVDNIWSSVSSFIQRQMSSLKGVRVPGLGTFTYCQQRLDVGNKYILIQRPVFQLSEKLLQAYGLKQVKEMAAGEVPVVPLNFTALTLESPFDRDQVEGCVTETLQLLFRAVSSHHSVVFTLPSIGVLSFRQHKVKMKFFRDFIMTMDDTGNLLWALSNRTGTSASLVSGRSSSLQRAGIQHITHLPKLTMFGQGARGLTEQKEMKRAAQEMRKGEAQLPLQPEGISTVQLAVEGEDCVTEEPEHCAAATQSRERTTATIWPLKWEAAMEDAHLELTCADHKRAGQELCYLCMQRAQRNVPFYLAEERLKEERDMDKLLLLNTQKRVQESLLKEQANKHLMQESNQKVAAFNLGVAEAMKKSCEPTEFHGSYLLKDRSITPPRWPRQRTYMLELQAQVRKKQAQQNRSQEDLDLLDHLRRVQLASDITEQRLQQVHHRNEDVKSYQQALHVQVRDHSPGIPACQPDSEQLIFGIHDQTTQALVQQRQRAQEVYHEQLVTAKNHQKEALFQKVMGQKWERDMLHSNHRQLVGDQVARYEKMHNIRASLEDNWSHSIAFKHKKDAKEKSFLGSDSCLLLDQCERYRRCFQCKRRPNNRGETNIWKESRYVAGSRLMV